MPTLNPIIQLLERRFTPMNITSQGSQIQNPDVELDYPAPSFGSVVRRELQACVLADENELLKIKQRRQDLEASLARKRRALSLIRCIPVEMLSRVFSFLGGPQLPKNFMEVIPYMQVCKIWSHAISNTPSLWTNYTTKSHLEVGHLRNMAKYL